MSEIVSDDAFLTLKYIPLVILTVVFVIFYSLFLPFNITNCAKLCDAQVIITASIVNIRFISLKFSAKIQKCFNSDNVFFEKNRMVWNSF